MGDLGIGAGGDWVVALMLGTISTTIQGLKIALVRSYLRVPQAAGQVEFFIFLVKIDFFPHICQ